MAVDLALQFADRGLAAPHAFVGALPGIVAPARSVQVGADREQRQQYQQQRHAGPGAGEAEAFQRQRQRGACGRAQREPAAGGRQGVWVAGH